MNTIALSGRLTRDPELIHRNDRPICVMRLAVDNEPHDTLFIDVRTFDGQAYVCAEYMRKGSQIGVTGNLAYNEWRDDKDALRCRYSVIGRVDFLDPPPREREPELQPLPQPSLPAQEREPQLTQVA